MLFLFPHEEDWGDEWEAEDEEDGGGAGTPLSPQDSVFSPGPGGGWSTNLFLFTENLITCFVTQRLGKSNNWISQFAVA